MSLLSIIIILTFLSSPNFNSIPYNFSAPTFKDHAASFQVYLNYTEGRQLKCCGCIDELAGIEQKCFHKVKFITCKYSSQLINWYDVQHKKSRRFGCLVLKYKERNVVRVKTGCVALPYKNYNVCNRLHSAFENIVQCHVCETDKCNSSGINLVKHKFKISIVLSIILSIFFIF